MCSSHYNCCLQFDFLVVVCLFSTPDGHFLTINSKFYPSNCIYTLIAIDIY